MRVRASQISTETKPSGQVPLLPLYNVQISRDRWTGGSPQGKTGVSLKKTKPDRTSLVLCLGVFRVLYSGGEIVERVEMTKEKKKDRTD